MREIREHRGVTYSVPNNDDGVWHYQIHPGRLTRRDARPEHAPANGYDSRAAAMTAATKAIDGWLFVPTK